MIQIDKSKYENLISEIVNTKDINSLVSNYSRDKIYYCSVLKDISNNNSPNSKIVNKTAYNLKLSSNYIREQAFSLLSQLYPQFTTSSDYYEILNVTPKATKEEIRKKWTQLIKDSHPDLVGDKGLDISSKINEAYSVLKDEKKKREYDSKRIPLLKVYVEDSHLTLTPVVAKFAILLCLILLPVILYFLLFNKEDHTELASFQTSDVETKQKGVGKELNYKNSKILKQIENIEPKKKQISESPKNNFKETSDQEPLAKIETKINEISDPIEKRQILFLQDENNKKVLKKPAREKKIVKTPVVNEKVIAANKNNINPIKKSTNTDTDKKLNEINKKKLAIKPEKKLKIENKVLSEKNETLKKVNTVVQKNKVIKQPSNSSLFRFVSDYVTAYKDEDIQRIESLFLSDAIENGMPISKAIGSYQKNFNDNSILQYDVKVNKTEINDLSAFIDSEFNIVFKKLSDDKIKTSSGSITWNLIWDKSDWKIKDINYNIHNTKRMDKSL